MSSPSVVKLQKPKIISFGEIEIDFTRSLADVIRDGNYDYANPDITERNFPHKGTGKVRVEVVGVLYRRNMQTSSVEEDFRCCEIEPAHMLGLATFGEKFSEEHRRRLIVALGQNKLNPNGNRHFGCLGGAGLDRELYLYWDGDTDGWNEHCIFLGLRKLPAKTADKPAV